MKQKIIISLIAFLFFNLLSLQADEDEKVFLKIGSDSIPTEIQSAFEAFRGPLYNDPGLPAFALVSRNKRIAAGIGGYVRFTTSFDFAGVMPNRDFIPFLIPIPASSSQRSQFNMDASTSRLFLRILAQTRAGLVHFFVETDFRASGDRNRFSAIYASLRGWRLGRYWSVMADLDSYPPSVDFQGPNSFAGTSTYQISYEGPLNKHFSFGVGLELPDYSIADSLSGQQLPQRIPTLPAYIQYGGKWGHVRLAALARPLLYKNAITSHNTYAMTWGMVASAFLQPFPKTNFYLQTVYGDGIGNYNFELNGLGLDLVPNPRKPGKLQPAKFWGGYVGVKYAFSNFFQASSIYSQLRFFKNDILNRAMYRVGKYLVFTGYFTLTPRLELAIEYDFGSLELKDRQSGDANRVIGMIRYNF